jgi:hypothetical protein
MTAMKPRRKYKRRTPPPAPPAPAPVKGKPGRKPIPIPDLIRIENIAAMGATNDQIANALGVSETTLKSMRHKYPSVEQVIKRGKDRADLQVIGRLYKKALDGDTTAMIFWLKNRQPTKWRDRHNVDHGGEVSVDNKVIIEVVETKSK